MNNIMMFLIGIFLIVGIIVIIIILFLVWKQNNHQDNYQNNEQNNYQKEQKKVKENLNDDILTKNNLRNRQIISDDRFLIKKKNIKTNKKILVVNDLHVSFGENKILKGVNFDLNRGETIAIVGKNGAGKTVMMETVVGLIKKDKGEVNIDFFDKKEPIWKERKEIGMQFQDSTVTKNIKAKHLINFYKEIYKEKINDDQIKEMIKIFGIKKILKEKIGKLSGGQKQRINLFLAIMHNPKLMILDEFITGLDIISVIDIINYVNDLKIKNNSSMIIISHQPEEIKNLADRILVLKDGIITLDTTPKKVEKEYESMTRFLMENI